MEIAKIGIIGGSGLYQMPELEDVNEVVVDTPFGPPSDAFIVGTLENNRVAFLPRLLVAMDTPSVVVANWYRSVYEAIVARELAKSQPAFPLRTA